MKKEKLPIVFPTWEEIEKNSTEEYISFQFKQKVKGNLYVTIERRKALNLKYEKRDRLVFSLCTHSDSIIASEDFPVTEKDFKMGMFWLYAYLQGMSEALLELRNAVDQKIVKEFIEEGEKEK